MTTAPPVQASDPTPPTHRADRAWYRQRSLYAPAIRWTFIGLSVIAAWVSLAIDLLQ